GAVCLERPHFHLTEALTAELRLARQRLLGDQRVRTDRASVDLVVDQVAQLQHVDRADGDVALELGTAATVAQARLAGGSESRATQQLISRRTERLGCGVTLEHLGQRLQPGGLQQAGVVEDRKSTRLNSSHVKIS